MTDSIIYEAQPIPPEDPNDAKRKRWSAIFGAVSIVAILLIGVAVGASLFRGSETEPIADGDPTATTLAATPLTTVAKSPLTDRYSRAQGGSNLAASEDGAATRPARPGGTDVGTPTPALPPQDFTWERITLDLPEGQESYLHGVYATNDGFLALGFVWSERGQDMVVWSSEDGSTWARTDLNGDFSNASVWNVVFNEYGAIAFGEEMTEFFEEDHTEYRPYQPVRLIWTSPDGVNWTRTELDLATADNQEVWVNTGLAGPDGYIVVGQRSTSPEFEPFVIEKDGYQLELNEYSYTYRVLDTSGAVVAEGSLDDIYSNYYDEDGQAIINPDTGELLTVVPWETWEEAYEQAYSESSDGPFGGFGGFVAPELTIEHDGYRIIINEETYEYRLEDIESGEVISSGSADYLWRGPAPTITDAGGIEILSFTWEEFDAAQQAHWEGAEAEFEYTTEAFVASSSDGVTWTETPIGSDGQEVSLDSIITLNGGYLAFGSQWDEFGGGSAIWTSPDGMTWTHEADMPGGMYIWNVQKTADGTLLSLGEGPQGPALWSSTDGIAWGEAFGTRIPEDRTMVEWFNQFGTGDLGTVIVGSRDQGYYEDYYAEPLSYTQDDYTLTFDDYDWPPRVTIVDDITGDVVIDLTLSEDGAAPLPEGFTYEDGVTYIEHNDIVLMAITDEDWDSAQEARWMEIDGMYEGGVSEPTMYFSTDLAGWVEVPFDFEGWVGHVAVGSDVVVLAGQEFSDEPRLLESDGAEDGAIVEDLSYYVPPAPVLFIGRP
ncbi:MAG: hypothetical protein KJP22_13655 [Acidimicrobiia bacterium]|nr:hypothetical protein [Acidimicrobiia bacterium]